MFRGWDGIRMNWTDVTTHEVLAHFDRHAILYTVVMDLALNGFSHCNNVHSWITSELQEE